MISIEIPIECHVAFKGLQFAIITELNVIIPSKEAVHKYLSKKSFSVHFATRNVTLKKAPSTVFLLELRNISHGS